MCWLLRSNPNFAFFGGIFAFVAVPATLCTLTIVGMTYIGRRLARGDPAKTFRYGVIALVATIAALALFWLKSQYERVSKEQREREAASFLRADPKLAALIRGSDRVVVRDLEGKKRHGQKMYLFYIGFEDDFERGYSGILSESDSKSRPRFTVECVLTDRETRGLGPWQWCSALR